MSFAAVVQRLQALENPYPGLRAFDIAESHLFFGRDAQVAELVSRLERHRFLAVIGVSGSGKSSLVRAGLIPALERGGVSEAERRWRRVVTQPAGAPFESLAEDLAKSGLDGSGVRESSQALTQIARQLPADETLLVVVDQFEELFRYKALATTTDAVRGARDRQAADAAEFVQLLMEASRQHPAVYVVITMRSDYLGDCAEFRDLPEALNECQYLIPRMTRQERQEAIELPLGRVAIAPSLVQRLLNDAGDEPDQLPILQHSLMRTWNHWRKVDPDQTRPIQVADYEAIGGFEEALNRHAEELLSQVPKDVAACVFKRLTARGKDNRERRDPATLQQLWDVCGATTPEQRQQVVEVIDRFRGGDATFLRPRSGPIEPGTYVDITHESLIRLWKTLRDDWLPAESLSARGLLSLAERAHNWKAGVGDPLGGLDLERVRDWQKRRNKTAAWARHYVDEPTITAVDEFVTESERRDAARLRKQRLMFSGKVALAVMALIWIAGWYIESRQKEAERLRAAAELEASVLRGTAEQAEKAAEVSEIELQRVQSALVAQGEGRDPTPTALPPPPPPDPGKPSIPGTGKSETVVPGSGVPSAAKPRIYIQIRNRAEASRLGKIKSALVSAGFPVPPEQVLDTGPSANELRYFRRDDRGVAEEAQRALTKAGVTPTKVSYVPGLEGSRGTRRNHLELWLAPADALQTLVRQLDHASEDVRKAAGARLARDHRANPAAISLVLETLSEKSLASLTANGRINALFFLTRSDASAWTPDHKSLAVAAIDRIRGAGQGAVAVGRQTSDQLTALEQKLAGDYKPAGK